MIITKRISFFFVSILIIFFIAFWGFKNNFPGESLSRVAQIHLTKQTGIAFEIKNLELEWQKLSTPEIKIHLPSWVSSKTENTTLIIEEVELPFSSLFSSGKVIINGKTHGGQIKFSIDIFSLNNLEVNIQGFKLEKIPLPFLTPNAIVSGNLSFATKIKNIDNLGKQKTWFPDGYIRGKLLKSTIIFAGDTTFFEFKLPELNFSEIFFDLQIGTLISIERIELKGSFEGIIDGSIKPNINQPKMSFVDLNLKLVPSSKIIEEFKSFTPMLVHMKCGETINVNLKGSMNRINFPTRNKC